MQQVELKTWHNGLLSELLLSLPQEGTWEETLARVEAKFDEAKSSAWWRGAQLTLELGLRTVTSPELEAFVLRLRTAYDLLTVAVITTDRVTQEAARALTLNVYQMPPGASLDASDAGAFTGNNALYLPHTVRSGQRIVHGGTVIVGGDVNAGAEILAEGDILVFGTLRGLAHAGSRGDEKARIVAGSMRPQQVRIAAQIARAPEGGSVGTPTGRQAEVAHIENGAIAISPL